MASRVYLSLFPVSLFPCFLVSLYPNFISSSKVSLHRGNGGLGYETKAVKERPWLIPSITWYQDWARWSVLPPTWIRSTVRVREPRVWAGQKEDGSSALWDNGRKRIWCTVGQNETRVKCLSSPVVVAAEENMVNEVAANTCRFKQLVSSLHDTSFRRTCFVKHFTSSSNMLTYLSYLGMQAAAMWVVLASCSVQSGSQWHYQVTFSDSCLERHWNLKVNSYYSSFNSPDRAARAGLSVESTYLWCYP